MARMIPSQPVGRVSPEVATAFRRLKQMPGDDCVCCLSLPLNDEIRPEFLVIYKERKAFLLSVSPVSAEAAESRSEEHTSELQSRGHLVCRLMLAKKKE